MKILVIAEHDNKKLNPATLCTITAAKQLSGEVVVLVAGHECQVIAEEVRAIDSVQTVWLADTPAYKYLLAENLAALIVSKANEFSHILAPATTFGKNLMPRVAALLDVSQISDINHIIAADTFVRPIYAGNVLATVQSLDKIKVITVRTTAFNKASRGDKMAAIESLNAVFENAQTQFVTYEQTVSERPELTAADVIIAGGRGLQSGDNFQMLTKIADRLNAAVGATRAAVDAGFVPNDYQVGQTGKVVAPKLYIAVGISGAIQHLAGMKDSKVIVAINKDPDAPIFQVADYGLVGDLFEILPQLEQALVKLGY